MRLPFLKTKVKTGQEVKVNKKPSKKHCYFCSRQESNMQIYRNDANKKVRVCALCVEYAERRAYRKN